MFKLKEYFFSLSHNVFTTCNHKAVLTPNLLSNPTNATVSLLLQWSLRSNSTPDTRDVWTDTEKESDDRTDSGITSPNSHHHLSESPCDLSIDNIQHDEVRKRLTVMSKRNLYDDDDKSCLIQVLSLLNNLEALSHDQEITSNDISLDFNLVSGFFCLNQSSPFQ